MSVSVCIHTSGIGWVGIVATNEDGGHSSNDYESRDRVFHHEDLRLQRQSGHLALKATYHHQ